MATKCFILLSLLSLFLLTTTISARPGIHFHPCNTLIISFETRNPNPNPNSNSNHLNPIFLLPALRPLHLHGLHRFRHPRRFSQITELPLHHKTEITHLFYDKTEISRPTEMTDLPLRFKDKTEMTGLPLGFKDRYAKAQQLTRPSEMTDLPFGFGSFRFQTKDQFRPTEFTDLPFGFSSFRDRTKDILSVVASLLFGAACGALTAGTMYLVWSIVNYRHGDGNYRSFDGFSSDEEDDDDNDDLFNPKKSHYVAIPAAPVKENEKEKDAGDVTAVVVAKETA